MNGLAAPAPAPWTIRLFVVDRAGQATLLGEDDVAFYIRHEDIETEDNGTAFFGPFADAEMDERLNDAVADMFAQSGNVDAVSLNEVEIAHTFINTREWWMKQLAEHEAFEASA